MRVDLDDLERARAFIRGINECPLENIEWVRRGKTVPVAPSDIEEWKFIGLGNVEFAEIHVIGSKQDEDLKGCK